MKSTIRSVTLWGTLALGACASAPDHFYMLNTLPDPAQTPHAAPTLQVRLSVTVPALVDRAEMVINKSTSGVAILSHERWAIALSDEVAQTLARDIERRRGDLVIADGRFDQAAAPPVSIKVDIVRMTVQRSGAAGIEAHWRIVDSAIGMDHLGSDSYSAPVGAAGYAGIAQAYSAALSQLADVLAAEVRPK